MFVLTSFPQFAVIFKATRGQCPSEEALCPAANCPPAFQGSWGPGSHYPSLSEGACRRLEGFRTADISGPWKLPRETPARPEENAEALPSPVAVLPLGLRTKLPGFGPVLTAHLPQDATVNLQRRLRVPHTWRLLVRGLQLHYHSAPSPSGYDFCISGSVSQPDWLPAA